MSEAGPSRRPPLAGVRVLDFAWVWIGGTLSHLLSDFGAEVIKVESHTRIDLNRRAGPFSTGVPDEEAGVSFHAMHRNSLSTSLDLKRPEALRLVRRLVAISDVLVENFTPRFLPSRGLSYQDLRAIRPDLIMVSVSAAGQTGPSRDIMTYGPAIGAMAGMEGIVGYPGERPTGSQIALTDPTSGALAAFAIMAALRHRARTGRGQHIDISQWEAAVAMLGAPMIDYFLNHRITVSSGNRHPWMAPHGVYRCAGPDQWIALACATERQWQALVREMGSPEWCQAAEMRDLAGRSSHPESLDEGIEAWTATQDAMELTLRLQAAGVAAHAAMDTQRLIGDAHSVARQTFRHLDHPKSPNGLIYGIPWKLSETPGQVRTPAPFIGQHNLQILGDLLGASRTEVRELEEQGVAY